MLKRLIQYIAFRTTKQYTKIKIRSLEPNYWDKDTLLLHVVMQLVVDFVEVECAFMELDAPYTLRQWINFRLPWFLKSDEAFRNRDLGLRHLEMLASTYEDLTKDASDSPKKIKSVYLWWKDVRPNRPCPGEVSGFNTYMRATDSTNRDNRKVQQLLKKTMKVESQYEKEDTEMLKKVIDARDFMWT